MLQKLESYDSPGVIVTDPPRAGMHPKALETMLKLGARTIVYVSCNIESCRDGREICRSGYRLVSVQPVDMFPHTVHIESVACFPEENRSVLRCALFCLDDFVGADSASSRFERSQARNRSRSWLIERPERP